MIYLYLFGTCFHFIYVFMIIGNIYCRIMDIPPAPSITHYGRNPIVVFILYGNSRIANLYQMEVSLDSLFLDVTFYSFCDH